MKELLIFFTAFLGVLGILLEPKNKEGKLTWKAGLLMSIILILAVVNFYAAKQEEELKRSQEIQILTQEQKRHSELLKQFIINSKPLDHIAVYYTFELDTLNLEILDFFNLYLTNLPENFTQSTRFYIPLKGSNTPDQIKFPFLFALANHTGLSTTFTSHDSTSLRIQSGPYSPSREHFYGEMIVNIKPRSFTIRYTDLMPFRMRSDMEFSGFSQLINAAIKVEPFINEKYREEMNVVLGELKSVSITNRMGNKVKSVNIEKGVNAINHLLYESTLLE